MDVWIPLFTTALGYSHFHGSMRDSNQQCCNRGNNDEHVSQLQNSSLLRQVWLVLCGIWQTTTSDLLHSLLQLRKNINDSNFLYWILTMLANWSIHMYVILHQKQKKEWASVVLCKRMKERYFAGNGWQHWAMLIKVALIPIHCIFLFNCENSFTPMKTIAEDFPIYRQNTTRTCVEIDKSFIRNVHYISWAANWCITWNPTLFSSTQMFEFDSNISTLG